MSDHTTSPQAENPAQPVNAPLGHSSRQVFVLAAIAVVIFGSALAYGSLVRIRRNRAVDAAAAAVSSTLPRVNVAVARRRESNAERILPGNALPLLDASLFARVTGYVDKRLVDIGDRVSEGQLLAVIAAPDVDDLLKQAQANVEQAQATLRLNEASAKLAETTLARNVAIRKEAVGAVAQQAIDEQQANVGVTTASVEAARATIKVNEAAVERYSDLQRFEKIVAPFAGVITARNVDPGDLVSADSTSRELFHLMRTDVLRVFVNVPQIFATGIQVGQDATVYLRDDPLKTFAGKVTRTADALDPATRTLLTELQVPNPDNALRPGMYLQVKFIFNRESEQILIPSVALAIRTGSPRVGVLDEQNRVHYQSVQLGRDFGTEIAVLGGLSAGDRIVVHPGDDLPDGATVEPVVLPEK